MEIRKVAVKLQLDYEEVTVSESNHNPALDPHKEVKSGSWRVIDSHDEEDVVNYEALKTFKDILKSHSYLFSEATDNQAEVTSRLRELGLFEPGTMVDTKI